VRHAYEPTRGVWRGVIWVRAVFGEALVAFGANPLRSALTVLDMSAAVCTVLVVLAVLDGLDGFVAGRLSQVLSPKSFTVVRLAQVATPRQRREWWRRPRLTLDDVDSIAQGCTACAGVGALSAATTSVRRGTKLMNDVLVRGATDSIAHIGVGRAIESGRPLGRVDLVAARMVVVLGADVVDNLFPASDPLGRTVVLWGRPLRVVGTLERLGSAFGQPQDNRLLVPITTLRLLLGGHPPVVIEVEARSTEALADAEEQVRTILRRRHHLPAAAADDFDFVSPRKALMAYTNISNAVYVGGALVAGIGVTVAVIVVTNVMLMSVAQRTREIGVRRSVGARWADIVGQFVAEALLVTVSGALAGILAARMALQAAPAVLPVALSMAHAGHLVGDAASMSVHLTATHVLLGVAVGAVAGVTAGVYPACRAARLDPALALRAEG